MPKKTGMTMKDRVAGVLAALDIFYPHDDKCFLDYSEPYQLMIATILSAQCTDARVNLVTKDLFVQYPSIEAFARAKQSEMEEAVRQTGFFRMKAEHIIGAMQRLLTVHNGVMPSDIDALTQFPGVGRKTANVVRSHIFNLPSIVVDTHVKRISYKLGLTDETEPQKVEFDLMKKLPQAHWIRFNTQLIAHGRAVCIARRPQCENCGLQDYCMEREVPA